MNNIDDIESSSEKINYLIRPAKQIERKLIVETLRCLDKVYPIEEYEYVGMGSLFFVDFKMVHKYLGINSMKSFEYDEKKIERFEFNKPYNFIDVLKGMSTEHLPDLKWNKNHIIWLDYDYKISTSVIDDIKIIANNIKNGGVLIITLDAKVERFDSDDVPKDSTIMTERIKNFINHMEPYHPADISKSDLQSKNFPKLLNKIINLAINENKHDSDIKCNQIFNFTYKDGTKMYTYGCIFEKDIDQLEASKVFEQDYISQDDTIIEINVPILTPFEIHHFDKLIPDIKEKFSSFPVDPEKLDDYERYYKFFPQYFESY